MNTRLKIALILCTMVALCLGSVPTARAYSVQASLLGRVIEFAASLLEPAVYASASVSDASATASRVEQDTATDANQAGQLSKGAFMPFMSFERLLDEPQ